MLRRTGSVLAAAFIALVVVSAGMTSWADNYYVGSKWKKGYYWSSGWDTAKTYEIGGHNYLILIKSNYYNKSRVHINILGDDCAQTTSCIGSKIASYTWSKGWTDVVIYEHGGQKYFMFYKASNGEAHVHRINSNGTVGTRQYPNAYLGSSVLLEAYQIEDGEDPYLIGAKSSPGQLTRWHFNSNGVPVFDLTVGWEDGAKAVEHFTYQERHFLFFYYDDGSFTMYPMNGDDEWSNQLGTQWELTDFLYIDGYPYLLLQDADTGYYEIYAVVSNGWITDRIQTGTTTAGYSSMSFYVGAVDGETYWHALKYSTGYTAVYHMLSDSLPSFVGFLGHRGSPLGKSTHQLASFDDSSTNPFDAQNTIEGMLQILRDPSNVGTEFDVYWDGADWRVAHSSGETGQSTVQDFLAATYLDMIASGKTLVIELKSDTSAAVQDVLITNFLAPLETYGVPFYVGAYYNGIDLQRFADSGYSILHMLGTGGYSWETLFLDCDAVDDEDVSEAFNRIKGYYDTYRSNAPAGLPVVMHFMTSWLGDETCAERFEELSLAASSPDGSIYEPGDMLLISHWSNPFEGSDLCRAEEVERNWNIKQIVWSDAYPEDKIFLLGNRVGTGTSNYLKWDTGWYSCD